MNPANFFCERVRGGEVIQELACIPHEFTKNVNANLFAGNEAFVT